MIDVIRIFVSSTWIDLQPERKAVETALHRMKETKLIGMESVRKRVQGREGRYELSEGRVMQQTGGTVRHFDL